MKKKTMITGGFVVLIGLYLRIFNLIYDPYIYGGIIIGGLFLIFIGLFINKKECSDKIKDKKENNNSK